MGMTSINQRTNQSKASLQNQLPRCRLVVYKSRNGNFGGAVTGVSIKMSLTFFK
jgi:hypothetical protein